MRKTYGAREFGVRRPASAPLMRQNCRGDDRLPKKKGEERGRQRVQSAAEPEVPQTQCTARQTPGTGKMSHEDGNQKENRRKMGEAYT